MVLGMAAALVRLGHMAEFDRAAMVVYSILAVVVSVFVIVVVDYFAWFRK